MSKVQTNLPTDEWVTATWDEYVEAISDRNLENAKSYYHKGQLRIERTPQGYLASSKIAHLCFMAKRDRTLSLT